MRLSAFLLFAALFALVGLLTVHEEVERIRCGYRRARLVTRRETLRLRARQVEADIAVLRAPERLERLNQELALGLAPLRVSAP